VTGADREVGVSRFRLLPFDDLRCSGVNHTIVADSVIRHDVNELECE
jgi:hypothetical protein